MVSECGGDGQARGEGPRWDEIKEEQLWEGAGSGGRWKSQRIKAMGSQRKRGSPGPEAGGFPDEEVIRSALKGRWQEGEEAQDGRPAGREVQREHQGSRTQQG